MSRTPPQAAAPPTTLRARRDGWTPERQQHFLGVLAASRSATKAAAAVGMSVRSAYKLRDHPAGVAFAAAWAAALERPPVPEGPTLIDRVVAQETVVRSPRWAGGGPVTIDRPASPRLLIRLLGRAAVLDARVQKTAKP